MNIHWLMRAKRWVQHPPSWTRIFIFGGIVLTCLVLYGAEQYFDWDIQVERLRPPRF